MIQNRNMTRAAKKRIWTHNMRPLTADLQSGSYLDMENDLRVVRIDIVFTEASGASEDETVQVGTHASATLYAAYVVADSQAAGTKVNVTPSSTALLPAGTPLVVRKAAAGADTASTALLSVNVHLEIVDKENRQ